MTIVGLCGFIGSGKSTAAEYLSQRHGFVRLSFAHALKDTTAALFGWDRNLLEGNTAASRIWRNTPDPFWSEVMGEPWTPRYALQFMGTDVCRNHVHPEIWIHTVFSKIHKLSGDPSAKVVIDDVRFTNEINSILAAGGQLAVVRRAEADGNFFPSTAHADVWRMAGFPIDSAAVSIHPSEWDWLQYTKILECPVILNTGSMEEYHKHVELWYTGIRKGRD